MNKLFTSFKRKLLDLIYGIRKDYFFYSTLFFFLCISLVTFGQTPTISSFTPLSTTVGSSIIINGTGFNGVVANNFVNFGGVTATIVSGSTVQLTVKVPPGASFGKIEVRNGTGIAQSLKDFNVKDANPCVGNLLAAYSAPYAAQTGSRGIATGDLNGDGFLDLVTANQTGNTISVLTGTGLGTFGPQITFATGSGPVAVVIEDFNGDGKMDIASSNYTASTISVLTGSGTGSFALSGTVTTGTNPYNIIAGDFDGDYKMDLVSVNYGSNTISFIKGNGNGTFAAKVDYGTGTFPGQIAKGDFNADGKWDIVVTNVSNNSYSILTGVGNGTFNAKQDFNLGFTPRGVAVGDFNNDGKNDLAISNNTSGQVAVLNATGSMTFAVSVGYITGSNPWYVAVGDFNGDGNQDLSVANVSSQTVSILNGDGTGAFGTAQNYPTGNGPYGIAVGDYNKDGKQDIAEVNNASNDIYVLLNTCPPTISSFTPSSGPIGSLVTILGTYLGGAGISIANASGVVVSNSATQIVGFVMPGATTGLITVSTPGGVVNSATSFTITPSTVPCTQQGSKLVGTGSVGTASQGYSIALSADGNTAIVGGYSDNSSQGAAWVWTRNGGTWTQQGSKLVGSGNVGASRQGQSVSISADGNTAIIGGYNDNTGQGAVWIWTRSGGVWTQQGSKLVGSGNVGAAQQGYSVSISADGNTAIVGGYSDNSNQGSAWIWTRSGSTWTQQGSKLVGSGNAGAAQQGYSVSISADGNTVIIGGNGDNSGQGAAWVWTRNGGVWTQQGSKLVGTGNLGFANQGFSVSTSADGNTAIIGGYNDNSSQGAAWIWKRIGTVWSQQGAKLVGTGNIGAANQGWSVSINADGSTAIVGGYTDNSSQGAAWVWARNGSTWSQQINKFVGTGNVGASRQGATVYISADGNTAIAGGYNDNGGLGAAWVYTSTPAPIINFFTPTSGVVGSVITLSGSNFSGINSVSFGGITASSFTLVNSTTITAVVGAGTSGVVSVVSNCGTATLGGFTFTAPGAALDFDGINDYVDITPVIPYTNDFTLEAWVKTTQSNGVIYAWGGPTVNNFVTMEVYFGYLRLSINNGSTQYLDGGTLINNNTWNHIAVAKTGTSIKLYVNGVLDLSATSTNVPTPSTSSIGAGLLNNFVQSFFKGQIDEVRVWNRGLCQAEIQNNKNCDVISNRAGLIAQYSFNQGNASAANPAVTSLLDKSANGYTGTLTNFGLTSTVSNWVFPGGILTGATCAGYATNTATITSFSPSSGSTGAIITLTGSNFTGVTAVYFGGFPAATFTVVSATKITSVVGNGNSGAISINPICGSASIGGFTYIPPAPTISSFTPLFGPVGSSVIINGSNFGTALTSNGVYFGGRKATVLTASANSLTVSVPAGASYGPITILTNSKSARSASAFSVSNATSCGILGPNVEYPLDAGFNPTDIVSGDFDNDGDIDLAVCNSLNGSVSIFKGNGTGGFSPKTDYSVGIVPQAIAMGDFNNDGNIDLATANQNHDKVTILLGAGNASFTSQNRTTGQAPVDLVVGDFNNDGNQDIITINSGDKSFSVLLGDGTGSFGTNTDFALNFVPTSIVTGEFKGDGNLDLAITQVNNSFAVFFGDGLGGFVEDAPNSPYNVGINPVSLAVGEFNGDGSQDIVVANNGDKTSTVYFGVGSSGAFTYSSVLSYTANPLAIAVADYNGDGKGDIVSTNYELSGSMVAYLGDGSGSFPTSYEYALGVNTPQNLTVGDFNKDGKQDFGIVNYSTNTLSVLVSTCTGPPSMPKGNLGLYFDGVDDAFTYNSVLTSQIDNITLEAWVKPLALPAGNATLLYNGKPNSDGYGLFVDNALQLNYKIGGIEVDATGYTLEINKWTHVALVIEGGQAKIYINGSYLPSSGWSTVPNQPSGGFNVGSNGAGEYFKGEMDEVRVYESARIESEIITDMSSQSSGTAKAYWSMDDALSDPATNKVVDQTTNGGDVDISGSPAAPIWAYRVSNTLDDGSVGSLRWAVNSTNLKSNTDYIDFSIQQANTTTVSTISFGSQIVINNSIILDGYSAYGAIPNSNSFTNGFNTQLRIELDLTPMGLTPDNTALQFTNVNNSIIKGFSIYGLGDTGGGRQCVNFLNGSNNTVSGCWFGYKSDGTASFNMNGVYFSGGSGNVLGYSGNTPDVSCFNVIANVIYQGVNSSSPNSIIQGNYIGIAPDGITPGFAYYRSISLYAPGQVVRNNVLGRTVEWGIQSNASSTLIQGNYIGVGFDGITPISNEFGIQILSGIGSTVGGINAGEPNIIGFNTNYGIQINGSGTINHLISGNSIYGNAGGIQLINGGNNDKPAPSIVSATTNAVSGTSEFGDIIQVFYDSPQSGTTDQGRIYLGQTTAIGINWTFAATLTTGSRITATATDGINGTSPFSVAALVVGFKPFITSWKTTTSGESITIPTDGVGTYNYSIAWGDGLVSTGQTTNATHTYATSGIYSVSISGIFPAIKFAGGGDKDKILSIDQWGDIAWSSMNNAFNGCSNLVLNAIDSPNLSAVTDLSSMFQSCTSLTGNSFMNNWDVSTITNMNSMFINASFFNAPLGSWNTSAVKDMSSMFKFADSFNQDISTWDVGAVTTLGNMFESAIAFDQPLNGWGPKLGNVTNMNNMFRQTIFNQDISSWDVSNVTDMSSMFYFSNAFNQDIRKWDVSNVLYMNAMFGSSTFDQNIGDWGIKLNPSVDLTGFLNTTPMSVSNYDSLLIGFNAGTVIGRTMDVSGLQYCLGLAARANLTSATRGWTITGDAIQSSSCLASSPPGNRGIYLEGNTTNGSNLTSAFVPTNVTDNLTMEAWVKLASFPSGYLRFILYNGNSSANGYGIYVDPAGKVSCFIGGAGGIVFNANLTLNTWTHVALVRNSGVWNLYINGISQAYSAGWPQNLAPGIPSGNLVVGNGFGETNPWAGQIDEVKVFASARSVSQIQADMISTTPDGAAGYWNFEEQSGSVALDLSGNGNNSNFVHNPLRALRVTDNSDLATAGLGSLRQAITDANVDTETDYIDFSLPSGVQTIQPTSPYTLNNPVFIDGFSQLNTVPGENSSPNTNAFGQPINAKLNIIVNGAAPGSTHAFLLGNQGSEIKGIVVNGFSNGAGFYFNTGPNVNYNKISGCFIGTDRDGLSAVSNNLGFRATGPSSLRTGNTIGGINQADRNLISGNSIGIADFNTWFDGLIQNNYIGTDAVGNAAIPNYSGGGIDQLINSSNVVIANNVISGNTGSGIIIASATSGSHTVKGNRIGTTADGLSPLPNGGDGILIFNNSNNTVGGLGIGDGNTVAYNGMNGVAIQFYGINNLVLNNSIFGNTLSGIWLLDYGNNGKAAPVISNAFTNQVNGTCQSGDLIEVFYDSPQSGTTDQGRVYLGQATTTGTNWSFVATLTIGSRITATATDAVNGTSPFSVAATVTSPIIASALDFDGVDDYIISNDLTLANFGTNDFTVEGWFNTTVPGGQVLFSNRYEGSNGHFFNIQMGSGKLMFEIDDAAGNYAIHVTTATYNDGMWHHLALARQGNMANVYVDGNYIATLTSPGVSNVSRGVGFLIGFRYVDSSIPQGFFKGQMDEIRLWNRYLCQTEIQNYRQVERPGNSTGLLARYDFNQGQAFVNNSGLTTLIDSSGNGKHATLNGFSLTGSSSNWIAPGGVISGSTTTSVQCIKAAALDFDGVDDVVTIPTSASFNTLPLTVECWIKTNSTNSCYEGLVNKYASTSFNGWSLFRVNDLVHAYYYVSNANFIAFPSDGLIPVNNGTWHHVAMVIDATGGKLFVDGVLSGSGSWTGTPSVCTTSQDVSIGAYPANNQASCTGGQYGFYTGSIDEVRIWNRALCSSEILSNKNGENPSNTSGLLAKYDFNQGYANGNNNSVTTLVDSSGNGYNGTLANFSLAASTSNWIAPGGVISGSTTTSVACIKAAALDFDGNNDYVATTTVLSDSIRNFTMEADVYWRGGNGRNQTILYNGLSSSNGYGLVIQNAASPVDQLTILMGGVLWNTTGTLLNINSWNKIVVVNDNGYWSMYLNGGLLPLLDYTIAPKTISGIANSFIGNNENADAGFNGTIDNIRFWNRPLCSAEIASHATCEKPFGTVGLVAKFDFNSGFAGAINTGITTAFDSSSTANHGTLYNFALTSTISNWVAPGSVITGSTCAGISVPAGTTWTWVGGISPDWFSPCNWDKLSVPNAASDVVIPGGTPNQPSIINSPAYCNRIDINTTNGGVVNLDSSSGGQLIITQ